MDRQSTGGPIPLRRGTLAALPEGIRAPGYDVSAVRRGIVHLGLGGFHRAHMARYTHDLMERDPAAMQWGIAGAVLRPDDRRIVECLAAQDGLYTLTEREGADETVQVVGSLTDAIFAGESTAALLDIIDDPAIRIVSLTVTENGYCLDAATKRLDPDHALVQADLARPERPQSAIGVIVEALRRRRAAGTAPFTVLTCDNIQANGRVLRRAVLDHARLGGRKGDRTVISGLADWIEDRVAFPNSMVDRITPVTSQADIDALAARGLADRWPVLCETFSQWVVEDAFPSGRPAWERVGAQFVPDAAPYEFMKLRLLNGSHLVVSGIGRLAGYATIHESMADPRIRAVMIALMDRETGPTVPAVPGIDLAAYKTRLVARFANPAIHDSVDRVNNDAPLNVLLDPLRSRLEAGASVTFLALGLAAWIRRLSGRDERGLEIPVRHPQADLLRAKALQGGVDPAPVLSIRSLFGDTGRDPRLAAAVGEWLAMLYEAGVERTLDEAVARGRAAPEIA